MKRSLITSFILAACIVLAFGNEWANAEQFQGRVYEGDMGVETTPLAGVTVSLYGAYYASDLDHVSGLVESTTTDADGIYYLNTSTTPYTYYIIYESMPSGYNLTGARTVDGTVIRSNLIQYATPLGGKTLTGNKFYVRTIGDWNHPPVAVAGGPYFTYSSYPTELNGSSSYDTDPGDNVTLYEWFSNLGGTSHALARESTSGLLTWVPPPVPGQSSVILLVTDTHGATSTDTTTFTIIADMEFYGRVFEGAFGVETTPIPGVTLTLYGSTNPGDLGTEITDTTTDGNGWYSLIPDAYSYTYQYYNIVETDPPGYISTGAQTGDAILINPNQIQYAAPIPPKNTLGNKFYDEKTPPTGMHEEKTGTLPDRFGLYPNYPNPFNPTTKIRFELPITTHVSLKVYDVLGKEIVALVNGVVPAGYHEVEFSANNLAGGVYLYRLQAGPYTATKKLVLLK